MISLLLRKILPGVLEGNSRPGEHRSNIQYTQELMREQNTAEHNQVMGGIHLTETKDSQEQGIKIKDMDRERH